MNRTCNTLNFVAYLALLIAVPAFTQSPSPEATPDATTAAPVAWIYAQTFAQGVNVYGAAPDGKLTLVKGSPFKTTGTMETGNGSHFFTFGNGLVYSYAVESNGGIGKQVSEIDTQDHDGSQCGDLSNSQAVLDHTGRDLYVQMNASGGCAAIQTYYVAKGSGELTFRGAVTYDAASAALALAITGNDALVYAPTNIAFTAAGFRRESDGTLKSMSFKEIDPTPQGGSFAVRYFLQNLTEAQNNLAAIVCDGDKDDAETGLAQVASYAVDEEGNITSTNTWEDMPYVLNDCESSYQGVLNMSPSGKILAVMNRDSTSGYQGPYGLSIFHFDGNKPITPFGPVLNPSEYFASMYWDNSNHLYALSNIGLHVFTITPTKITEAPGSPYTADLAWYGGLVVVSR
jgi:hypothetical protein